MQNSFRYFVIYKPFGVVSQFSGEAPTLASLHNFPKDVYPVGRLDKDSEGLLLITNDASLNQKLLNPRSKTSKTYWVQVDGAITEEAIAQLRKGGIQITTPEGNHFTAPCEVNRLNPLEIQELPERIPPVRFRKNIPTSWISITLTEGKNRQIRKMTAAVGYPTLRIVRVAIGNYQLREFNIGKVWELGAADVGFLIFGS